MVVCIGMPILDPIYSLDEVASFVIHRKLLDLDFLIPSSFDEMLKIGLLSNMIQKGFIMLLEDNGIGRLE